MKTSRDQTKRVLLADLVKQGVQQLVAEKYVEQQLVKHYDTIHHRHPKPKEGGPRSRSWD
ncbi:MAG: hypothetical protein AABX02_01575 [archaeon]